MTGIWMAVFKARNGEGRAYLMVGRLFMGPGVFHNVGPGIDATTKAVRHLRRTLSGKEPPSRDEMWRSYLEKRKRIMNGEAP